MGSIIFAGRKGGGGGGGGCLHKLAYIHFTCDVNVHSV